jgi:hypothetical protein
MRAMRSWMGGVVVVCAALVAGRAHAAQTVEVAMNGHRHVIVFPDGWRASREDGGVYLQPPVGRDEGLQVVVVGVPTPAKSVTALQMAKNIAAGAIEKRPYLSASEPEPMQFLGVDGAVVTLDGTNPSSSKRERTVFVMAMRGDTTYLLQAAGSYDELAANLEDIRGIASGVQVLESAAAPVPPAAKDEPAVPPPAPDEPLWTKDAPLPAPPAGAKYLLNDAMLGVQVGRLAGWGVSTGMNTYVMEHRLDPKSRVVASIWLGSDKFTGSGSEYMKKVAGEANARWDRFGQQDALIIERPPQLSGAGDVLEIHVLRGETAIVFSLRFDGGAWKDKPGREALAELDGATKVGNPGKAKGAVAIAGGVAKIKPGKDWEFEAYGPGAMGSWKKGELRARVAVFSKGTLPPPQCEDQSKPAPTPARVGGREASLYSCPKDAKDQLVYTVPVGDFVVYLGYTDASAGKSPAKAAAEFGKFVRF